MENVIRSSIEFKRSLFWDLPLPRKLVVLSHGHNDFLWAHEMGGKNGLRNNLPWGISKDFLSSPRTKLQASISSDDFLYSSGGG